jgi:hypothetical protein
VEKQIMKGVGLFENYSKLEGTNSCVIIREKALEKLPIIIGKLSDEDKCEALNPASMKLLESISRATPETSIKSFHEATTEIIRAHIETKEKTEEEKMRHYAELHSRLVEKHIGFREKK